MLHGDDVLAVTKCVNDNILSAGAATGAWQTSLLLQPCFLSLVVTLTMLLHARLALMWQPWGR